MNDEIPNDEGWGNLIGPKKTKAVQEKYGIPPHKHSNGLMSCYICVHAHMWGDDELFKRLLKEFKRKRTNESSSL